MNGPASRQTVAVTAWVNIFVHVAALAFAALAMRPGTPGIGLEERVAWLAQSPPGWTFGWGLWMLCALADFAFIAAIATRAPHCAPLATLAVTLATAGAAVDLMWDSVHILVIPTIARARPFDVGLFLATERMAWAVGAIVANSFYSTATLLVTLSLRDAGLLSRWPFLFGLGTFGCGMLMCVAGFTGVPFHLEAISGPTIACFLAWTFTTARALK